MLADVMHRDECVSDVSASISGVSTSYFSADILVLGQFLPPKSCRYHAQADTARYRNLLDIEASF